MEGKNLSVILNKEDSDENNGTNGNKSDQHYHQQATIVEQSSNDVASNRPKYGRVVILLENPILPDATIIHTPSMADGLEQEIENDLRITGCKLIQISGILLRLPQVAMATGQVLFQRFYYSKSFVRQPMEIMAMACVVLASKVEEAPRRIRDVINVFHNMKQIRLGQPILPKILDENYVYLKNQVIKAERRILKELGFCVHVKHPHKFIVAVAQILKNENNVELIQTAWNYMNDSLQTNVFVRFPPEAIACACIHLSSRILRVSLPTKPLWYELFNVNTDSIESICKSILMLYTHKTLTQEELETKVDEVRQKLEAEKIKAKQKLIQNSNLDNTNSPTLHDSHTDSPNGPSSESVNNKNYELKSVIGKLTKEKVMDNDDINKQIEQESDHSSISSSSSSFKLQKSPMKNEDKNLKRSDEDENYRNTGSHRSSHRYKNGHSTTATTNQDFYFYSNNDSKERRARDKEREYRSNRPSNNRLPPQRSYISIVTNNDRQEHRCRDSRSRSRSPISPYEDYASRHKYHRRGDERSSHRDRHYEYRHEDRSGSRYEERSRRHEFYQNRSKSRSPNYSSSRHHNNYYKTGGKY